MKKLILLAVILCCSTYIFAQSNTEQQELVEVSVRVSKDVLPDEIFLNITINEKDNKGKTSVEQQEKEMVKTLGNLGIDVKEALTINDMESSLQKYVLKKDDIFVTRNYTLKVSTAPMATAVIDALNKLNIARVGIGKVSISPELEKETKNQLLTDAAKKAQENAKILAQAVGSEIGKAVYIQNYYSFDSAANGRIMMKAYSAMNTATSDAQEESTELQVSKQQLSINVTCRFRLF